MPHYKPCLYDQLKLLSNHFPRFLTHGLGLIRLLPTVMEHESCSSSCCRVPTNKNSVLSSLIINRSWIIHFLTASMHFSIACIASAWAVLPSGLKLRYSYVSSAKQTAWTHILWTAKALNVDLGARSSSQRTRKNSMCRNALTSIRQVRSIRQVLSSLLY